MATLHYNNAIVGYLWKKSLKWNKYEPSASDEATSGPVSGAHLKTWILFIYYLSWAVLGLRCCTGFLPSCGERVYSLVVEADFSLRGFSCWCARALGTWDSVVVAHGLSCSRVYGIFPTWGSNLCLLLWSQILYHWATREALESAF